MSNNPFIFIDIFTYFFAFLFFPFLFAFLVKKIGKFKEIKNKFIFLFVIFQAILSLFINQIWGFYIFNHLYYEWDYIVSFKFSLFTRDSPVSNLGIFEISKGQQSQGSWIANGFSQFYLFLIWFFLAIFVYIVSIFLSKKLVADSKNILIYKKYIKILSIVFVILFFINGIFPIFELIIFFGSILLATPFNIILKFL